MKAKIYLFFLVWLNVSVLITGCEIVTCVEPGMKTDIPENKHQQFTGEWQWYKTYNGWLGLETPAKMGYSETISFGSDNIYKKFRNGMVIEESPYTIAKIKSYEPGRNSIFIYYLGKAKAYAGQPLFLVNGDTLHTRVLEVCYDCAEEYYVRKKVNQQD